MRQIDDYFSTTLDKTLYHYTGIGSFINISNAKCIWASNAYYMNDSAEVIHACNVLQDILDIRLKFGNQKHDELAFLKQFYEWVDSYRKTNYNVFIFSLSEKPSLLSQWRSYTPHGKGVSIGFSNRLLTMMAQNSNLRIARCIYDKQEQKELLSTLIEKLLITFNQKTITVDESKASPDQCYYPFLEKFRGDVLQVLSIIKHSAFEEEKEWRLISEYFPNYSIPSIKFREGASMLVPYIEISLGDTKPYFEQVILGPSPHQNLSMSALQMFLSNQGLCRITSNCSIPYKEW